MTLSPTLNIVTSVPTDSTTPLPSVSMSAKLIRMSVGPQLTGNWDHILGYGVGSRVVVGHDL